MTTNNQPKKKTHISESPVHDVDHMHGEIKRDADMTTDSVKSTNKEDWGRAVKSINSRVFDDESEFVSTSRGTKVSGNGVTWATWDNGSSTGWFNAKGRKVKPHSLGENAIKQGVAEGAKESYIIVRTNTEGKKDVFASGFDTYEQAQKELDACLAHPLHTKHKQKFEIKQRGQQGVTEGRSYTIDQDDRDEFTPAEIERIKTAKFPDVLRDNLRDAKKEAARRAWFEKLRSDNSGGDSRLGSPSGSSSDSVYEGEVVAFPKKHPYEKLTNCPSCGSPLQGGKDEEGRLKLCLPCMIIYRAPNQQGVAEERVGKSKNTVKYYTIVHYPTENEIMVFSSNDPNEFGPGKGSYKTTKDYTNLKRSEVKNKLNRYSSEFGIKKLSGLAKDLVAEGSVHKFTPKSSQNFEIGDTVSVKYHDADAGTVDKGTAKIQRASGAYAWAKIDGESIQVDQRTGKEAVPPNTPYYVFTKSADTINELSTEMLGRYKTAAGKAATAADAKGDFKTGNKRFSGIVKATKKQFANSEKAVSETTDIRELARRKCAGNNASGLSETAPGGFSPEMIATLKSNFNSIERIDPASANYKKLVSLLNSLDQQTLQQIAGAGIKFVSSLAANRVKKAGN